MSHEYKILTTEDQTQLRIERVRALEADIFRAELALEDALSDPEREAILADIEVLRHRLQPHYAKIRLLLPAEPPGTTSPGGAEDARTGEVVPPATGGLPEKSVSPGELSTAR